MDDRRAHFLTMAGDACTAAGLADIPVELTLEDGSTAAGVPSPRPSDDSDAQLDHTGYENQIFVGGSTIRLDAVVGFAVRTP